MAHSWLKFWQAEMDLSWIIIMGLASSTATSYVQYGPPGLAMTRHGMKNDAMPAPLAERVAYGF